MTVSHGGRHEKRCEPANLVPGQFGQKMWTFWIKTMIHQDSKKEIQNVSNISSRHQFKFKKIHISQYIPNEYQLKLFTMGATFCHYRIWFADIYGLFSCLHGGSGVKQHSLYIYYQMCTVKKCQTLFANPKIFPNKYVNIQCKRTFIIHYVSSFPTLQYGS